MVDTILLQREVKKSGLKYKYIARQMNLSPYGLQNKICSRTEFKASEIDCLSKLLSLSTKKRDAIFFSGVLTDSHETGQSDKAG